MTIRNLSNLFHPASIALVGASEHRGTIGAIVLENLIRGGFPGKVYAVNPGGIDQTGVTGVRSVNQLPEAPDLAIVMTPAQTVPAVIAELGMLGTKCAVVISAGVTASNGLRQCMLDAARPHLLRVVGPNCLGIMAQHASLNATFARTPPRAGALGLISQRGALVTAMLDWADSRDIGFSGIVSAGDMADVDLGDLVDLFAVDPMTDAILLYVEEVTDGATLGQSPRIGGEDVRKSRARSAGRRCFRRWHSFNRRLERSIDPSGRHRLVYSPADGSGRGERRRHLDDGGRWPRTRP